MFPKPYLGKSLAGDGLEGANACHILAISGPELVAITSGRKVFLLRQNKAALPRSAPKLLESQTESRKFRHKPVRHGCNSSGGNRLVHFRFIFWPVFAPIRQAFVNYSETVA